jgi:hypothetical protein
MNTSGDDTDTALLWRLTADQRQQIYEEEKRRIEQSAPAFSTRTKILAVVYLLGCALLYFGLPQSVIEFCGTRNWKYEPEADIFLSLLNAVGELIRPFLAFLICGWTVAIPAALVFGVWSCGNALLRFFRRLFNRDNG